MGEKAASPLRLRNRGSSPPAIKPKAWTLILLLALCCSTLEARQQRSGSSRGLIKGELMTEEFPREAKKDGPIGISSEAMVEVVSHGPLQPLDNYVNAKRKLNLETAPGYKAQRKSYKGRIFQISGQKGVFYRKSWEYKGLPRGHSGGEKHSEYPGVGWEHETEKIPLASDGDESGKEDKELKHGSSIMETEVRIPNQPLLSGGTTLPGRGGTMDRHERQRLKQRKNNRKHGRIATKNKKGAIPLDKRKPADSQSREGAVRKGMVPGKEFHLEKGPSIDLSSEESLVGQEPTREDIDPAHGTIPDESGEGPPPEAEVSSLLDPELTSAGVPPRSVVLQHQISRTSSGPSGVPSGYVHHDDIQESPRRASPEPKGTSSIAEEDRGRVLIADQRENRGRRHLDDKEGNGDHRLEGQEEGIREDWHPPEARFIANLTTYNDGDRDTERRQEMSVRQPIDWGSLGNYPNVEAKDESPLPWEDDWAKWDLHQPGLGSIGHGISSESGCGCWDTDAVHPEMECNCRGPNMKQIPANLSAEVFRITVMHAGLDTLRNDSFTRYRTTLQDIVLQNVDQFHTIEAGAFSGLRQLRSIYIHSAPELKFIGNFTFTEDNAKLRSLRIVSSGLEHVPNMEFRSTKEIFHMIELDSNRIQKVHSRSLHVQVEELSLNYNHIQSVEKEAFLGSLIGKLSLKGNQELTYLHPEAFAGIVSLGTLDLSETSITALPTAGLKKLEVLLLENTPSLKVFPSVYSFKEIKKAFLTYPYHCCAFQFPEQHDREQYINHKKLKEHEQEHCSEVTSPSSPVMAPTTRVRRRRYISLPLPTTPPAEGFRTSRSSAVSGKPLGSPTEIRMSRRTRALPAEEEEWGNVLSGSASEGDIIILSSVRANRYEHGKRKRHRDSLDSKQLFDDVDSTPVISRERPEFVNVNPPLRRSKRNIKTVLMTDAMPHSKTRHYVSRGRRSRPRLNTTIPEQSDSKYLHREGKSSDHMVPPRHQPRPRFEALRASQLAESQGSSGRRSSSDSRGNPGSYGLYDNRDFIPVPDKRFETGTARSDGPLSGDGFEPIPGKRFGIEEIPANPGGPLDEGFIGAGMGAAGGIPNYYEGFGSFNHSADRYPPDTFRHNDTPLIGLWGDTQNWPGHDDPSQPFVIADEAEFPDASLDPVVKKGNDIWHPQAPSLNNNTTIIVECGNLSTNYHDVMCVPAPDAFNPCEDIMGNIALRVAVWFVVVTAVVGNLAVMLVLVSSKFKMTVSKFLMVNLALADLSMGIYLLIIASMDLHTIGVYFNYAIDWQNGPGCKVAGFLTVFASELSIFTLTVITSERWYAITYAIHLNKRLKLSMAAKIMVIGWIYSITMATLPLVGISGYSKTSICLPMETGNALALAYLISLLLVNGLAFFVITACYASMYCSISRHDASASHSDLTVAKRMALLVFTDFACWAPIAFFGLTAVAGIPLINVTRAKILLVFFYPLNSCANPYLYAILTKQYRRDLFILLERYGFCTKRAMRYKGAYSSVNNTFPHNTVVNAPNHRNSTLTQITLCDLTRTARTSQQSNNGSLLGTMIGGSQDSLQRSISPSRTPTKPETCGGDTERLSTVQEMSHSNYSDEENNSEVCHPQEEYSQVTATGGVKQAGSPHPIKNCYTRLSFTPEQEQILQHAISESKAKKNVKDDGENENRGPVVEENEKRFTENGKRVTENGKIGESLPQSDQGEAIVMCEVEVNNVCPSQEGDNVHNIGFDETEEATSTV